MKRKTKIETVYSILSDGKFHDNNELIKFGGKRFGARVQDLRDIGAFILCVPLNQRSGIYAYQMLKKPSKKIFNTHF